MASHDQRTAVREFSTRFLPADGIPAYNALLDNQLGKRREFLLGNPRSLELMQQTGVIDRIETTADHPNQYVVHMAQKPIYRRKRLPGRRASGSLHLSESHSMPGIHHSASNGSIRCSSGGGTLQRSKTMSADAVETKTSDEHESTAATLTRLKLDSARKVGVRYKPAGAKRYTLFGSTKCSDLLTASSAPKGRSTRSSVPIGSTCTTDGTKPRVDAYKKQLASTAVKGTVEHLLESDAAFMTQLRVVNEQLADLDRTKSFLDSEISRLRRQVRGVNAVRENDVAVAHCSSIMQHRISKAEEEYMKLVTQQQQGKEDVDRVRHELLSMRKVRRKLQDDSESVALANRGYDEKIQASKSVRTQLSEELSELERRAELELETQRLNLPPEDVVVVDVAKLMSAVKERQVRRRAVGSEKPSGVFSSTAIMASAVGPVATRWKERRKTLLNYSSAFSVLQTSLGIPDLLTLEEQFATTEAQLLSKYKATLALADEVAGLEKEVSTQSHLKEMTQAHARKLQHARKTREHDMQTRIQRTLLRVKSYHHLRKQRTQEHLKLRDVLVRALEALQSDGPRGPSEPRGTNRGTNALEEPTSKLLDRLQRQMTQMAIALKVKHAPTETSLIGVGPQAPSGSALTAILSSVQPPSVENAAALTETMSYIESLHGTHRAVSPARRRAPFAVPELGPLDGKKLGVEEWENENDGRESNREEN